MTQEMITPQLSLKPTRRSPSFAVMYLLSVVFNYHALLVAFTNSSYMERFTTPEFISIIYSASAIVSVLFFLFFSHIVERFGNFHLTIGVALLEIVCLLLMAVTASPAVAIATFFIFLVLNPLLYLCIDVFAEAMMGDDESSTGSRRGLILSLMSFAAALAPFSTAFLVADDTANLYRVYLLAACVGSLFIVLTMYFFRYFSDPVYRHRSPLLVLDDIFRSRTLLPVYISHFLLQIFFAWTTIYFPLYLTSVLGFSWGEVGTIIGIGLLAYVFLEYPAGIVADRYLGEQELMTVGFVVLVAACVLMPYFAAAGVVGWAALMFLSRVGAALVEATTETHFFKRVTGDDSAFISVFRLLRPLSMLAGSLIGAVALFFLPFQYIFLVLAAVMVLGIVSSFLLIDTR